MPESKLHPVKIQIHCTPVKFLGAVVESCQDIPSKIKVKLCALLSSPLMTDTALSGFPWILDAACTPLVNSSPTHVLSDSEGCQF